MWLICPSYPCVPASADLMRPSESFCQRLASSVASSGKLTAWKSWRGAIKKKAWVQSLAGRICTHSTEPHGVVLTLSSADTHASHFRSPVSAVDKMIRDTFGLKSLASLRKRNPASCFSKTSPDTYLSASTLFGATFDEWATALRQDCLRRLKRALRTRGRGCSFWPSATTPDRGPESAESKATRPDSGGVDLQTTVLTWPTPRSEDAESCGNHPGATDSLTGATSNWPTPKGRDTKGQSQRGEHGQGDALPNMAEHWKTPVANPANGTPERFLERKRESVARGNSMGISLSDLNLQAQQWQTPPAMGGGSTSRGGDRIDEPLISKQAANVSQSSRPDPAISTHGETSLQSGRTSPRLSPRFTCWLMGLAPGWTNCAPLETPFVQFRERMRLCLCGLVCAETSK